MVFRKGQVMTRLVASGTAGTRGSFSLTYSIICITISGKHHLSQLNLPAGAASCLVSDWNKNIGGAKIFILT